MRRLLRGLLSRLAERQFRAGKASRDAGDDAGATKRFLNAIAIDPHHAGAHYALGLLLAARGSLDDASRHLERALQLDQYIPNGWLNLGNVHYLRGAPDRALAAFRAALKADPDSVAVLSNLGLVLKEAGKPDEAIAHLRRARELAPDAEAPIRNLMLTLVDSGRSAEAVAVGEGVVAAAPDHYDAQLFLGIAYSRLDDWQRALACWEAAVRLRPDEAEAHRNRGKGLQAAGRLDEAIGSYDRALELQPEFPMARLDRALARLYTGDFEGGWKDYEARRASEDFPSRRPLVPEWDGGSLEGRSVLVYCEQGIGDEIMFASCLPALIRDARACVVESEPRLAGLFARSFAGATVVPASADRTLPHDILRRGLEVEIPIGSLPRALRLGRPKPAAYFMPDPARVHRWRHRLADAGSGLQVGISWQGGVEKTRRSLRSIPLERWLPILGVPNASFTSLQYTEGAADAVSQTVAANGIRLRHWQEAIDDFEEMAALVSALDLVISVCTAVVHLGGALGQRVWVMAPYVAEWRYGRVGETMPWYPRVRLIRQPAQGEWEPVIDTVASDLQVLAAGPNGEPLSASRVTADGRPQ